MTEVSKNRFEKLRRAKADEEIELMASAIRWIALLPKGVRPIELGRQFPRIANRLAMLWVEPSIFKKYLNSLLIDDREIVQAFRR
jgi:hypothetical protein